MPKFLIVFSLSLFILSSCVQETPDGKTISGNADAIALQNRINQLELDNSLKDSVINESLAFFNEIKSNLEAISVRKDEIRALSENPELSGNDKEWILEEIKHINFLRESNATKVRQMQDQMKKNGLKIRELEVMIESLVKDIQWKDEQISLLQSELNNLDREYSALFDAYQEQSIILEDMRHEMNVVHYAYGSEKELVENEVIDKKNGFLGMGKKTELKEHFNDDYFTEIDASKQKTIMIEGDDIHFITYHPKTSYSIFVEGSRTKIKILDASEFWKLSKYLVVIVD